MAKKFSTNTSAFSIAHYILLFLVVCVCITIIAWVMISHSNPHPSNNITTPITHVKNTNPCVQRTINTVAQMWAYNPEMVPQRYWDMAEKYMNETITTRTYGICMDVAFTCHAGQIRRDCDPCAVPSARDYAQSMHTANMIQKNCGTQN